MILTKEQYAEIYRKRIYILVEYYKVHPEEDMDGCAASFEFDNTATVNEIVGYYIVNEGDNALNQWLDNIDGIEMNEQDKEIDRILKQLYRKGE